MSFTSRSRWSDVVVSSAAQLLAALATFLVMVTQILVFQQRGASGFAVAALVICEALPMVVLGKPIGLLVDRIDSRLLLVVAGVAGAVACLALAQAASLPAVLAGVTGLSLAAAVSSPTHKALLPAMVVRDDLPRANAVGQTAGAIGMMAGPALAGFLVGGIGPQATVRFAAIGFAAWIVAAVAIHTRRGGSARTVDQATTATAHATVDGGGWSLGSDPLIRLCVWGLTAVIGVASAVNVVLVFFVMGTLGSTPEAYGVIDASWMVGTLVGAWLAGMTVRPATGDGAVARRLVLGAAVVCAAIVATGSVQTPWWIVPGYLVGGAGNAAINVFAGVLLGRRVPAAARGRANTATAMRVQAGAMVGFVAGGLMLEALAPRWIVLGCGVAGLLTAAVVLRLVRRLARATAPAEAPIAEPAPVG